MNQVEISEKTGISQSQISKIFKGKPIGKTTAKTLGEKMGIKWHDVFAMSPDEIRDCLIKSLTKI